MGRACSTKTYAYRILVRKSEGERPLGRSRLRSVGNIKMDLRENEVVWAELKWLMVRTSGGFL
jgi:hypothetical protein